MAGPSSMKPPLFVGEHLHHSQPTLSAYLFRACRRLYQSCSDLPNWLIVCWFVIILSRFCETGTQYFFLLCSWLWIPEYGGQCTIHWDLSPLSVWAHNYKVYMCKITACGMSITIFRTDHTMSSLNVWHSNRCIYQYLENARKYWEWVALKSPGIAAKTATHQARSFKILCIEPSGFSFLSSWDPWPPLPPPLICIVVHLISHYSNYRLV